MNTVFNRAKQLTLTVNLALVITLLIGQHWAQVTETGNLHFESIAPNCCKAGQFYADRWPSKACTSRAESTLYQHLNASNANGHADQCEIIFRLCCLSRHQSENCDLGRSVSSGECSVTIGFTRYSEAQNRVYECCQACKLGTTVGREGRSCTLPSILSFDPHWVQSFNECCSSVTESPSSNALEVNAAEPKMTCENGYLGSNEKCICANGYRQDPSGLTCVDVDECQVYPRACAPWQDCINAQGSYRCMNKPADQLRPSDHHYRNLPYREESTPPSPSSQCETGYTRNNVTGHCENIDECADYNRCAETHRCIDTPGSFLCIRRNECGTGYQYNLTSDACEDINECTSNPEICGSLSMYSCHNAPGTYRCTRIACAPGQNLQPDGSCRSIQCPDGYEKNDQNVCDDIDECLVPGRCPSDHRCINLPGTYQCRSVCETGLRFDAQTSSCIDIDECVERSHNCRPGQTCVNSYRSFSCSCPPGQQLDEMQRCIDIDECTRYGSGACPADSKCVNTQGSFECVCSPGYRSMKSRYTQVCVDIDECQESPWICPHRCANTPGSYNCSCYPGYRLSEDGINCLDIDECAENEMNLNNTLFCEGTCNNTQGSYRCTCPPGFQVRENRFCDDINECLQGKPCNDSICLNTIGGHKCYSRDCPEGYIRDSAHTHRCKKPRSAVECSGDSCYQIYKTPLSYSYSYISLPFEAPIPPSGMLSLITARGPLVPGSTVQFKLNVTSLETDPSVEPATRDDFHLSSANNEAIISLVKPLKGEQSAKLELDLDLYQSGLPSGTTKIILILHISKYSRPRAQY